MISRKLGLSITAWASSFLLKVRCPYCDSLLLIEEGDCEKRYNWGYNNDGERKKYSYYVIKCPCCEEESNLGTYENIRNTKNSRAL